MESVAAVTQFYYIALLDAVSFAYIVLRPAPSGILSQHDALVGNGVEVIYCRLDFRIFRVAQLLVVGREPEMDVFVAVLPEGAVCHTYQSGRVGILCIVTGTG